VNGLPPSHHKHVLLVYISYASRRPDLSQPTVVSFELLQDTPCVYIYSWLTLEKWLLIREILIIERHDAYI
jgi:hypothetical protein